MHRSQVGAGCMCINLSRGDVRVPYENLNGARVNSVLVKTSCRLCRGLVPEVGLEPT